MIRTTRTINNSLILFNLSFSLPFKMLIESQVNPYFVKGLPSNDPILDLRNLYQKSPKAIDDRTH